MTTKSARADVTGLGAREPSCRGIGIAKIRRKRHLSVNTAVIRWMSVAPIMVRGSGPAE
jgi:hypothetical protein